MLDAVAIRAPFVPADEAALFLQVSIETARRRFDYGQLPQARRLDGGPFQPTRSSRLIPTEGLRELVDGDSRELLDLWQEGAFKIPVPASRRAQPIDFETVRRSLTTSVTESDEEGQG